MKGARVAAVLVALALGVPAIAGAQDDDDRIRHRHVLPIDGREIDPLAPGTAGGGAETVRLVLSGTMTCAIDGSEIDAMARFVGGVRDEASGPFVTLPAGAQLVEIDYQAHRYVFEVPAAAAGGVALDVMSIARRHLITPTEARAALSGAIEVETVEPPAPPLVAGARTVHAGISAVPLAAVAGAAIGAPLLLIMGARWRKRRRSRPELGLLARAARARAAIQRESDALGLAFVEVSTSSERLLESAGTAARHVEATREALARTASMTSSMATVRRTEILEQQAEALARLTQIVERLEDTAARLAAHRASHARARNVDTLARDLTTELDTAVAADTEAHAT